MIERGRDFAAAGARKDSTGSRGREPGPGAGAGSRSRGLRTFAGGSQETVAHSQEHVVSTVECV